MEEVFCMACGKKIAASAQFCPHCGAQQVGVAAPAAPQPAHDAAPAAPQPAHDAAPAAVAAPLPAGVKGWSWGGFWLNWLWAAFNKVWIGLLALIPLVNLVMMVVLGLKGREWAWLKGGWRDVEHFRQVQRKWDIAAWIVFAVTVVLWMAMAFMETHKTEISLGDEAALIADEVLSSSEEPAAVREAESSPQAATPGLTQAEAESQEEMETEAEWPEGLSLPDLRFSKVELFKAMRQAGLEAQRAYVQMYLYDPDDFMATCIADLASKVRELSAADEDEALDFGEESCRNMLYVYHTCLDRTPLPEALACLKQNG